MTKRKLTLRCISIILCLAMIIGSSHLVVTAEDIVGASEIENENNTTENTAQEGLIEDISLRDKFTKHYVDEDGTRYAVIFPEQVHYEDADGEWVEVDNTLTYDSATSRYVSENEVFSTSFASSATSGDLVSVTDGDYTMSWSLSFAGTGNMQMSATATAQIVNGGASISEIKTVDNMKNMGKAASSVRYNSVWGVADVRYSIAHGRVEEDIILNSRSGFTSYMMTVNTGGLTATKSDDGSVTFSNSEGETIFTIDAPWMMDAASKYSDDIEVEVLQRGDTAYVIYAPSAEWLNDTERVYPVLIDPSFTTRYYTSNYVNAYASLDATESVSNPTILKVGTNSASTTYHSYVKILNIPTSGLNISTVNNITFTVVTDELSTASMDLDLVVEKWYDDNNQFSDIPTDTINLVSGESSILIEDDSYSQYNFDLDELMEITSDNYSCDVQDFFNSGYWHGFRISSSDYARIFAYGTYSPTLTITYGQYGSAGIVNDAVYSFKNVNSGKYLTVDSGSITNNTNIYQSLENNLSSQAFRLVYNSASGSYTINSICDSDGYGASLDFNYYSSINQITGYVPQNVVLFGYYESRTDNQEWLILPSGQNRYKILSRADPNLALTAYGTSDGTSGGTTSTSAGNVFVAEFTGASNQLWEIESGGARINGNNIRTLSSSDSFSMTVGSSSLSFCCPVVDFGYTVIWSSTNENVAVVDSNGNVTAIAAGETRITAEVDDVDGMMNDVLQANVTVSLENGVFEITAEDGIFLRSSNAENTRILFTNEENECRRSLIYKINHLGNGIYTIRSMLDNRLGWTFEEPASVNMNDIGTSNYNIADNAKWKITWDEEGYYIRPLSKEEYAVMCNYPTTLGLAATGLTNASICWNFTLETEIYSGIDIMSPPHYLFPEDTFDFDSSIYSSNPNIHGGNVSWSINNTDVATIDALTGELYANSPGEATVTVNYANIIGEVEIFVIPFVDEYLYTISGLSQNSLMKPQSDTNNSNILIDSYHYQKLSMLWSFEYYGEGYYKIKNNSTGFYLTAPENNSENATIQQCSDNGDYSLWTFIETTAGNYLLQSKNQKERTTSSPLYLTVSNGYVVQSSTTSYYEWDIKPLTLNMNVLYDQAFVQRFGEDNYVDILHNMYDANASGHSFASVFKERFGILVKVQFSNAVHQSVSSECLQTDCNAVCHDCLNQYNNSTEYECNIGAHHKSESALLNSISYTYLENSSQVYILYTGHITCGIKADGTHQLNIDWGRANSNLNRILMLTFKEQSQIKLGINNIMISSAVHEMFHCFGIENHCDQKCIMNSSYDTSITSSNVLMCDGCRSFVENNIFKLYNHSN